MSPYSISAADSTISFCSSVNKSSAITGITCIRFNEDGTMIRSPTVLTTTAGKTQTPIVYSMLPYKDNSQTYDKILNTAHFLLLVYV
jgi:hypothetical protein